MTEQVLRTTAPLKPEEIVKLFNMQKIEVSVEQSVLKDLDTNKTEEEQRQHRTDKYKEIIIFIKNLRKPITLVDFDLDFIEEYMKSSDFTYCENIPFVVANIMFWEKYNHILYPDSLQYFDQSKIENFIASRKQIVDVHRDFLESIPLFLIVSTMIKVDNDSRDDKQAMEWVTKAIPQDKILEEDVENLGYNIVNVCKLDNFLLSYLDGEDIRHFMSATWYARFFESYRFSKKHLIFWLEQTSFAKNFLGMLQFLDTEKYEITNDFPLMVE